MYRITYDQGNGYQCSCCRSTYECTVDLNTPEEVQQWVDEYYADNKIPRWEDADDRYITCIEKEIGKDISDEFEPIQENVDRIIKERQKVIDKEKEKEEKEKQKRKYEYYLKLKKEFEKDEN